MTLFFSLCFLYVTKKKKKGRPGAVVIVVSLSHVFARKACIGFISFVVLTCVGAFDTGCAL